jgi:hypothetical protein
LVFKAITTTGLGGSNNKIQIFLYNPSFLADSGGAIAKWLCRYAVRLPGLCWLSFHKGVNQIIGQVYGCRFRGAAGAAAQNRQFIHADET